MDHGLKSAAALPVANQCVKEGPAVATSIEKIRTRAVALSALCGKIEDRFSAVLKPENPPCQAKTERPRNIVALAACLDDQADAIESSLIRLQDILDRAEL